MKKIFLILGLDIVKKNLKYFISCVLLLTISFIMFISFVGTTSILSNNLNKITKTQNQEDFNFYSFKQISQKQINQIQKKYNLDLENQNLKIVEFSNKNLKSYLDITQNNEIYGFDKNLNFTRLNVSLDKYVMYISSNSNNINKLKTDSDLKNNEIAIDQMAYFQRNYDQNSKIKIQNFDFNIKKSIMVNNIYPVDNFILPNTKQKIFASLNKDLFEKINPVLTQYKYVGKFKNNLSLIQRSNVYEKIKLDLKNENNNKSLIYQVNDFELNPNIQMPKQKIQNSQLPTVFLTLIIVSLSIFVVIVLIIRLILKSRPHLGILKAMGYSYKSLSFIYLVFPFCAWFVSTLISLILSPFISKSLLDLYKMFFSIPLTTDYENIIFSLSFCLLILVVLILFSFYKIKNVLNDDALDMINNVVKIPVSKLKLVKDNFNKKFIYQIQKLILKTQKKLLLYFIFTFSLICSLIYLSLSTFNIYNDFINIKPNYTTNNIVYFNNKQESKNQEGEFNQKEVILENTTTNNVKTDVSFNNVISIYGLNPAHSNYVLNDVKNNQDLSSKLDNEIVISNKFAKFHNLKIGSQIKMYDSISSKTTNFKISNISNNNIDLSMYMSNKKFNEIYNNNKQEIIGQFSDKLNLKDVKFTMNKNTASDSTKGFENIEKISMFSTFTFALMIAFILIWITNKQIFNENKILIETMMLIGYFPNEMKTIVLKPFFKIVIFLSLVMYPLLVVILNYVFDLLAVSLNLIIQIKFNFLIWFIGVVIIISFYKLFELISVNLVKKANIKVFEKL